MRDGVWTDSTYDSEETVDVAVYSAAYFELLEIAPWIGPHLAVGESVIIRVGDVFVRIAEEGLEVLTPETVTSLSS